MTEYRQVPVEPTEEMWAAGVRALEERGNSPFAFRAALKAMLAAAPKPDELARLERENIELKRAIVESQLHEAECGITGLWSDLESGYIGECDCWLDRFREELSRIKEES